jgi:hypothetical protein
LSEPVFNEIDDAYAPLNNSIQVTL